MRDYRVKTKVNILTGFPSEEFNSLMFESAKQNIVNKITDIIKSGEVLPKYIEGDLFPLLWLLQIATFCGQQGRISRTVRAILSGQFEGTAGLGYPGPANQY